MLQLVWTMKSKVKELRWEKNFTLTSQMYNANGALSMNAIQDLFQTAARIHAEEMGIGEDYCIKNNYAWIVARIYTEIISNPFYNEEVKVITYPHNPKPIEFYREYVITSLKGKVYARGIALWVIVDLSTFRIIKKPDIYPDGVIVPSMIEDRMLVKPVDISKEGKIDSTYKVTKTDIDKYMHMNNARYAQILDNYIYSNEVKSYTINYANQIKENEVMDIYSHVDGNIIYLTGKLKDTVIFTSKIERK